MPTVTVTARDGEVHRLDASDGETVMEVLREAEIDEELGLCGGCCSCSTCHVYVDIEQSGPLPDLSTDEDDLLDSLDTRSASSRLGCQLRLGAELTEITVTLPPSEF